MVIDGNTTIAELLKYPGALDAIISISPRFGKLKNPILRAVMAKRTTIAMASRIGGCTVDQFIEQLLPLGFTAGDQTGEPEKSSRSGQEIPQFIREREIVALDVRPVLEAGNDPLKLILQHINSLEKGQALKIINTFEPLPLIRLLESKGYRSHSEQPSADLYHTYFTGEQTGEFDPKVDRDDEKWNRAYEVYKDHWKTIDVRELEAPGPMVKILEELEHLPEGGALYVYHKRIPVFLLPELTERDMDYVIREIDEENVHLIIYSKP